MKPYTPLLLDGRTGEGGGQLVRLACCLAAVTSQPVRLTNVRGNRGGGGGLKSQHVSAVEWLAKATKAEVEGLVVGSSTLEFRPSARPTALDSRKIEIIPESRVASTLLIFQAVFPYLLFAGNENGDPIELEIHGGTNCSFSLSYEYLDQVLLPVLQERYNIVVERRLKTRAWTVGPSSRGCIWVKFQPMPPGQTLKLVKPWDEQKQPGDLKIKQIDVSILVPPAIREPLETAMVHYLNVEFPEADITFVLVEETNHGARMYALAVAHSETGLRWGRDFLYDRSWKRKESTTLAREIAKTVSKRLWEQIVVHSAAVDEYLQDQLVVFQALAEGTTTYWSRETERRDANTQADPTEDTEELGEDFKKSHLEKRMRKDKSHEPFGYGSTHTTTARWVTSELMPTVQWFNGGTICEGAGVSFTP
ncbi:RNA 3'-terminal phosphate cyclase-domain-containing protein [Xylariaceae sp. FL1651]|nr:RNA 3'-terminal phosphate cyclase-domain-containing protein [Xylariaceae sp. FL1651]